MKHGEEIHFTSVCTISYSSSGQSLCVAQSLWQGHGMRSKELGNCIDSPCLAHSAGVDMEEGQEIAMRVFQVSHKKFQKVWCPGEGVRVCLDTLGLNHRKKANVSKQIWRNRPFYSPCDI